MSIRVLFRIHYTSLILGEGGGLFGFSRKSDTFLKRGGSDASRRPIPGGRSFSGRKSPTPGGRKGSVRRFPPIPYLKIDDLERSKISDPRGSEGVGAGVPRQFSPFLF